MMIVILARGIRKEDMRITGKGKAENKFQRDEGVGTTQVLLPLWGTRKTQPLKSD